MKHLLLKFEPIIWLLFGQGILLGTLLLSFDGPAILAPAMNSRMWNKPVVQRNVQQLRDDGFLLIDQGKALKAGDEVVVNLYPWRA